MTEKTHHAPVSLRISVTHRCPLQCIYCSPGKNDNSVNDRERLRIEEIIRLVRIAKIHFVISKIHLTGGEPLLRRDIDEIISSLAQFNTDLTLTTNGQQLHAMAPSLKKAGLQRINISLDSLQPSQFTEITGQGILQKTLDGIEAARNVGFHPIKLNMTVLHNINDSELVDMVSFAMDHDCEIRFLELMPIGSAKSKFPELFVSTEQVDQTLKSVYSLTPLPYTPAQSSRNYIATDAQARQATVGFISPYTHSFCTGCRRLRITSSGQLLFCLATGQGMNIRHLLRDDSSQNEYLLRNQLANALNFKANHFGFSTSRSMVSVGG